MAHPLDGAFLRVRRAEEHLGELKRHTDTFTNAQSQHRLFNLDPHMPDDLSKVTLNLPAGDVPPICSIIVGEVLYNSRAALDYLVYALALHDSGRRHTGTQCPIVDRPEEFVRRKNIWLKGLNAAHVARIEELQPYKGCAWTKVLRTLSNPDKHRHLTVLKSPPRTLRLEFQASAEPFTPPQALTIRGPVLATQSPGTGMYMYVQQEATFKVRFDDGSPVIETLESLKADVAHALQAFQSEF